jgi:hypothetical protein
MTNSVNLQRRLPRLLFILGLATLLLLLLWGMVSIAHADGPLDIAGYQGFTYPGTENNPSGEKPESKLWWHDGFWWGSLYSLSGQEYRIHRYDWGNKTWVDTGVAIDDREDTKADVLWDETAGKLYIVSHIYTKNASEVNNDIGRIYRYSYDEVNQTYVLDSGFDDPDNRVTVNHDKTETLVIDKDSTDKLWVTYISRPRNSDDYQVYLNSSDDDGLTWGTPFTLSMAGSLFLTTTHVTSDDIASLIAFEDNTGGKIGVMWSNQNVKPSTINFAYHVDGDADDQWTFQGAVTAPNSGDDHISLKSLKTTGSGKVFAAVKTDVLTDSNQSLIGLVERDESGSFSFHKFSQDNDTRPIVLIDEGNPADTNDDQVYVFVTGKEGGGNICYKSSPISSINFSTGDCGTADPPAIIEFIADDGTNAPTLDAIDNATSTKQNVNETTGIVVLATHQRILSPTILSERYYVFNDLGDPPPVVTARGPERDATNVQVGAVVTATFSKPMSTTTLMDSANFIVEDSSGPISGTISYDSASRIVTFTPDGLLKADTTYTVTLTSGVQDDTGHALFGAPEVWSFTTEPAKAQFSRDTYSVNEGVGTTTITVTLNTISSKMITVPYATSNGTAQAGSDYIAASGDLTFNPGQTSQSFTVTINEDANDEPNETVNLTLNLPTNADLGFLSSATLTIIDNDGQPTVQFSPTTLGANENSGQAPFQVTLSPASALTVTVDYATTGGTATAGSDYTAIPTTTLTFNPGETSKIFNVTINEDALDESDETVFLQLANAVNAALDPSGYTATLTIIDNDPTPSVEFSAATYTAGESAGTATITATLSDQSGFTVTVNYATSNGTATAGADYTAASGTLTFAPGQTSQTFSVPILEDVLNEGIEAVNLTLSVPSNAILGTPASASLRIDDNDPLPTVQFSGPTYSVVESAGIATITVSLSEPSGRIVSVDYTASDGTATAGSDYTAVFGRVDIPALQTSGIFTVPILPDSDVEADETVNLSLSGPSNASLGAQSSATLTIGDDDAPPTVQFSAAAYSVGESDGSATVTVSLSGPSEQTVTVNYATSNGTATAGADYTAANGTLTFNPGQTSQTFSVSILPDSDDEVDETVNLSLSGPSNATLGTPASATLTIGDDDVAPPTVQFSAAAYSVGESDGNATITVNLSGPSEQTVTVNYATSNGTATAGADYTTANGTLTFNPGQTSQTFSVPILPDSDIEADETVNLSLSGPSNATLGPPASATLTIVDDDEGTQIYLPIVLRSS